MPAVTAAIARLLNPLVWWRPGHAARKLLAFALAEQGSMLDMRLAARLTPSPARAAAYLRHADDEARHARMFVRRAEQLAAQADPAWVIGGLQADSEALFERLGELDFLAFVHHGEVRARMQFETYLDYFTRVGRERDRSLFAAILVDEQRHGDYTRALLVELAGGELEARRALRRAARWELGRRWLRAGRFVAERVYALAMLLVYVLAAPLGLLVRLARPLRAGWKAP
jgi:rubrerythrin